jgi:hypothetical protein
MARIVTLLSDIELPDEETKTASIYGTPPEGKSHDIAVLRALAEVRRCPV